MHSHGQDRENYEIQARDGVTTALELELGTADVESWYNRREGNAPINYGASVGHIPVRMDLMGDPGDLVPVSDAANRGATDEEIGEIKRRVQAGLRQGALAVGFGIQYTPAASRWEIMETFRTAADHGAVCHVHMRGMGHVEPTSSMDGLQELIAASSTTGAPVHVAHISSSGLRAGPHLLQVIGEAQARGIDVTTECYPYDAAMTDLSSAMFQDNWQERLGIDYAALEWADTGERLTQRSFARFREMGGMVIMHMIPEETVEASVVSHPHLHSHGRLDEERKGPPQDVRLILQGAWQIRSRGRRPVADGRVAQDDAYARESPRGADTRHEQERPNKGRGRRGPRRLRPRTRHRPGHLR